MPKCPSKACICVVLTLWITLGVCILIICSFLYLKPYIKVSRYKQTDCTVEGGFYTTQYVCNCGSGCKSSYPCYLVHVSLNNYNNNNNNNNNNNSTSGERNYVVILYQNNKQLKHVLYTDHGARERCSLRVCYQDPNANRIIVSTFKHFYGRLGQTVPCWYDPVEISAGATLQVARPGLEVLHALMWPFLFTLVGILLCVVYCKRCKIIDHSKDTGKDIELTAVIKPEVQKLVPQKSSDEERKQEKKNSSKKKKADKGKGKSSKRSSPREVAAVSLAERLASMTPLTSEGRAKKEVQV